MKDYNNYPSVNKPLYKLIFGIQINSFTWFWVTNSSRITVSHWRTQLYPILWLLLTSAWFLKRLVKQLSNYLRQEKWFLKIKPHLCTYFFLIFFWRIHVSAHWHPLMACEIVVMFLCAQRSFYLVVINEM